MYFYGGIIKIFWFKNKLQVFSSRFFSVGVFGILVQKDYFSNYQVFLLSNIFSISLELTIVGLSVYMIHRYNNSKIFGRSFLFLALGFVFVAIGNILVLQIDISPRIDSMFFFGLYLCLFCYLYINTKSFNNGFRRNDLLIIFSIVFFLTLLFYLVTSPRTLNLFLLHYCGLAVIGSSTTAAMALFGFKVLKLQPLGISWKLMSLGLIVLSLNDIWFHYWDTTSILSENDPVNFARYASYMIIIYALYFHKKVF